MTKRPSHGAPRPTATTTEAVTSLPHAYDETLCSLCERRPRVVWHDWCAKCIRDLGEALDRRRAAELRLPPLDQAGAP